MKSKSNSKRVLSFLLISFLVILGAFNLPLVTAIHMEGGGATFYPDDDWPTQYGVFIPEPNMFSTISIDASNQGRFAMIDYQGGEKDFELINYPGEDISDVYPWYFDEYYSHTSTDNNYTDPWLIDWISVTTLNPHNITLSNYSLNAIFNYYVLIEGDELSVPLNHSIPIQVDVMITSIGPKILKYDWLTDDRSNIVNENIKLISPSGKIVDLDKNAAISHAVQPPIEIFDYLTFVAHEIGAYRLLIYAEHNAGKPAYLNLEFISSSIYSLPLETLVFSGNAEDILVIEDKKYSTWQSKWYKINGEKGDVFRLQLDKDYATEIMGIPIEPIIRIWRPCENGYLRSTSITEGIHDIYFPTDGIAYISFVDADYGNWYRYLLFINKYETINYNVASNKTTLKVSKDQGKVLNFSIQEDSFIRFNLTVWDNPQGMPELNTLGFPNAFILQDSKKVDCYDEINPLHTETVDSTHFNYYYLPTGNYKGIFRNSDESKDGIIEIDSKFITMTDIDIPINALTYPDIYPSALATVEFKSDDYYSFHKEPQWFGINITKPGQLWFNTTISALDNLAEIPTTASPSFVIGYNATTEEYTDYTAEALAFDNSTFKAVYEESPADHLFIACTSKWHDMHFILTQGGTFGGVYPYVWNGNFWSPFSTISDTTNEFQDNGTWVLDIYNDPDFMNWEPGVGERFDIPYINEDLYYWLDFDCYDNYGTTIPLIDSIQLSNITVHGNIDFALIKDSGYEYSDFWTPTSPTSMSDIILNQEPGYNFTSTYEPFLRLTEPYIVGVEPGFYKLFVTPYGWSQSGSLNVQFGISDFKEWGKEVSEYVITKNPLAYPYNITNGVVAPPIAYNYSTYPYEFSTIFNNTLVDCPKLGRSYLYVNVIGEAYQWTQLVIRTLNVSQYDIWIMQDLPWIDNNGPNFEIRQLFNSLTGNNTVEFGVLNDKFTLIIVFNELITSENVGFYIDLSQYNTTLLTASAPIASYEPPSPGLPGSLVLGLVIGIPVAAGIIVVIYILKRKGRILTKHPV